MQMHLLRDMKKIFVYRKIFVFVFSANRACYQSIENVNVTTYLLQ